MCLKLGLRSCKELREAKTADWPNKGLSAALLGSLGSVLPALDMMYLETSAGPAGHDGVQRLVEGWARACCWP